MVSNKLSDILQVWGIEEEFLIFTDGTLGFGVECTPLDISASSDDSINGLSARLISFLNGLPELIDIQLVQDIKQGNREIIERHGELSRSSKNTAARDLCESRIKNLRNLDEVGSIPVHKLYLLCRQRLKLSLAPKLKFFSNANDLEETTETNLTDEILRSRKALENILQGLQSLNLQPKLVSPEALLKLTYEQWNPSRDLPMGPYDPQDVRSSLLFTDVGVYENGFNLSKFHHRVISLKILPDHTFAGLATVLRDLPFDSRLQLSIFVPDQKKELETLQTQRRVAFSMARGKSSGVHDIESESKLQDLESLLQEMIANGEKVFHVSLNITLRSTDQDDLENQVTQCLWTLRELAGSEGFEESIASFPIFSEISIPNARSKERVKRLKTSNLSDLLPIYGPWRGFAKPSILLRHRMGSLISLDPFASELTNSNHLISGSSGSGKSFLTNILLLQMLKEDPKVYFVDIGGSYRKLCENLEGQYLELDVSNDIAINPFDLLPGDSLPSPQKIKFLVGLVELMTKEDESARLPKLIRAEIEELIRVVYDTCRKPKLSDLKQLLLAHDDIEVKRYGRILEPWCGTSVFGRFVDRETNVVLNNPLVAFDLKGMEVYPELQAVCLFIITDLVWREVQKSRLEMKFLVFDECWKLLKSEAGLTFVEEVFRTFRKYNAAAIAISQDLDDFAKSKIAGAVLPNCSFKWILLQQQSDFSRMREVLSLNENEVSLIRSLRQEKGAYSEAFLMAQDQRSVVVVESTPLEYWIATTDPKDLAEVEKSKVGNAHLSNFEVLKNLSEKYPCGVSKGKVGT